MTRRWPRASDASEDTPELFVSVWAATELLEAATRCDEPGFARAAHERIADATAVAPTDWALGIRARSAALLSDGEGAEPLYREAIERLGRTRLRPELARTHLLYGEWLRRANRRVDARAQLRAAARPVGRDRHGGIRRARPARAARDGREGAQADASRRATS